MENKETTVARRRSLNMSNTTRIGIIDIGSNSIRLVVYERNSLGAHRVLSEYKDSARLSERIGSNGLLEEHDVLSIVPILTHFTLLCKNHEVSSVRAVATAAIRNAANSHEIVSLLEQKSGLSIEVLSGAEEARLGFLGVINTIDIQDGFIVDIGGGSTEITLFHNRKLVNSISFPFGSVNTTRQFVKNKTFSEADLANLRHMVEHALAAHPWIRQAPGLPLIGLGGTIRNLGKMSQKRCKYSLQLAHNYELLEGELDFFYKLLSSLPIDKRKKVEGLSKDRVDIIVPGLTILHTIYEVAASSICVISGSGLRDGLFYETLKPNHPEVQNVLETSIQNLLMMHENGAEQHVRHVDIFAMTLFERLAPQAMLSPRHKQYLHASALLYRIGVSINYYQFTKHTQYLISQARIDGFSHREILLCSLIASYKTKSRNHQMVLRHKDILEDSDELLIIQLAALLQLAIALDRGETQTVQTLSIDIIGKELHLQLSGSTVPYVELREIEELDKDFQKVWDLKLIAAAAAAFSTK
jgi:exopolyphosphatase/guanosine-5'-triphosphate,3'-diphosphate pyrophosphatase